MKDDAKHPTRVSLLCAAGAAAEGSSVVSSLPCLVPLRMEVMSMGLPQIFLEAANTKGSNVLIRSNGLHLYAMKSLPASHHNHKHHDHKHNGHTHEKKFE